jgi:chitin synthase
LDKYTNLLLNNGKFINIFFCVKHRNAQKLNSHLWFFNGFCHLLQPKYTILVDCGLIPDESAIFNLFKAMEYDQQIGGVCGFMGLQPEKMHDAFGKLKVQRTI